MEFDTTTIAIIVVAVSVILFTLFNKKDDSKTSHSEKKKKPSLVETNMKGKNISKQTYSMEEIAKHNHRDDCWIIVDGKVYDVTEYIDEHPGGESILTNAGGDSSKGVHGPQHPASMWEVLALFHIGEVKA